MTRKLLLILGKLLITDIYIEINRKNTLKNKTTFAEIILLF
jgi:hypothetical protein